MDKLKSCFRRESHPTLKSADSLSTSSTGPTLVPSKQGSSDAALEGDRLYEIFTPINNDRTDIDIVAIHGLMGNPYTTWTKGKDPNGTPWISQFLPSQVPHARIFSYGYDSNIVRSSSVAGIPEFAMNLLAWLKLKRSTDEERQRPLLFICHSLGGIIAKKVRSRFPVLQLNISSMIGLPGPDHCQQQKGRRIPQRCQRHCFSRSATPWLRCHGTGQILCLSPTDVHAEN